MGCSRVLSTSERAWSCSRQSLISSFPSSPCGAPSMARSMLAFCGDGVGEQEVSRSTLPVSTEVADKAAAQQYRTSIMSQAEAAGPAPPLPSPQSASGLALFSPLWRLQNEASCKNETRPVERICAQYEQCSCEDSTDQAYLNQAGVFCGE